MPVRFEATFTAARGTSGVFRGTILDDGVLGEAVVSHGLQTGRLVRFTKTYIKSVQGRVLAPVRYQGTLSEDGKVISGTWKLESWHSGRVVRTSGHWEAIRRWSESEEIESLSDESQRELSNSS